MYSAQRGGRAGRLHEVRAVKHGEARRHSALVCARQLRSASARVAPASAPSPSAQPTSTSGSAAGLYRPDVLFHGPHWRVLDQVGHDGNGRITASLTSTDLSGAIDGAHQLLSAWAGMRRGWLGLPVGAGAWTLQRGGVPARITLEAEADGDEVAASVDVCGPGGECLATASGVRLRRAGRWPADAPSLPLTEVRRG